MDADLLKNSPTGHLTPIGGHDALHGPWQHVAFVPNPLPAQTPVLSVPTFNAVADARAALAALGASAARIPTSHILRQPTLRQEAQSTSALEGTFEPLERVFATDEDDSSSSEDPKLREVMNYVRTAEYAFAWQQDGRPLSVGHLTDLQGRLVSGTEDDTEQAGRIRGIQVAIGKSLHAKVEDARFVPSPPGPALNSQVRDLMDWMKEPPPGIDPVVAAGMAHYQFETLHPFNNGNGRIGRLLIVLHLMRLGALQEPTLTVSPWFEARRAAYSQRLFEVSSTGNWDDWIRFLSQGLAESATRTISLLDDLLALRGDLRERVKAARLRAATAMELVDFAFERPIFTVAQARRRLNVTPQRANELVKQLVRAGVLVPYDESTYGRRFVAPEVLARLLRATA